MDVWPTKAWSYAAHDFVVVQVWPCGPHGLGQVGHVGHTGMWDHTAMSHGHVVFGLGCVGHTGKANLGGYTGRPIQLWAYGRVIHSLRRIDATETQQWPLFCKTA
ncbi:transport protein sec31 [Gossypium arboreum]|uniref:Transport protein sec31 n=1 Tax=Gossypium arboreum TaxID=29729 RepID=A0A0B0NG78_GOSAR|nr:transport protein sec31 [Gossypium arboreum]